LQIQFIFLYNSLKSDEPSPFETFCFTPETTGVLTLQLVVIVFVVVVARACFKIGLLAID
jgi:hypothetical protein